MQIGEVYRDKDGHRNNGPRYVMVVACNGGRFGDRAVCVPCSPSGERLYTDGRFTTSISESTLGTRFELQLSQQREK